MRIASFICPRWAKKPLKIAARQAALLAVVAAYHITTTAPAMAQDCSGNWVELTTQASIDEFQANHGNGGTCTNFTGYLRIGPSQDITNLDGLGALTSVQESLTIQENEALATLSGLDAITAINRDLQIYVNPLLTDLSGLEALNSVGASLEINDNPNLQSLAGLSGLAQVGRNVTIHSNPELNTLTSFISLQQLGWSLQIMNNPKLEDLGNFPLLTSAGGVYLAYNSALSDLGGLSSLATVGGGGFVLGILNVEHLDWFANLSTVSGAVYISDNPALTDLSGLANLGHIGGDLAVSTNPKLTNLNGLGGVTSLGGTVHLHSMPELANLQGLSGLNGNIGGLSLESLGITSLDDFSKITGITGSLQVFGNEKLTSINGLNSLTTVGETLRIQSNYALSLISGLNGLTDAQYIDISDNPALGTITGLSNLQSLDGSLSLAANASLQDISGLSKLSAVGHLGLSGTALADLNGLAALVEVGGNLYIGNNPALINLKGLGKLRSVGGVLELNDNNLLSNLGGLAGLVGVGSDFNIIGHERLLDIGPIPNLTVLGRNVLIQQNTRLRAVSGFKRLTQLYGHITIRQNDFLDDLDGFSGIQTILGHLEISQSSNIRNLDGLRSLQHLGGNFELRQNNLLENIDGLAILQTVLGNLDIRDNFELRNLNGLHRLMLVGSQLTVQSNAKLANCRGLIPALDDIDDANPGPGFDSTPDVSDAVFFAGNLSDCNSLEEILASEAIADLQASKQFSDLNPIAVPIGFSCDSDALRLIVENDEASISSTAKAVVRRYIPEFEPLCMATELAVPNGYQGDDSDCASLALVNKQLTSCVIANQQLPVPIIVNRHFSDGNPMGASVSLSCADGEVSPASAMASTDAAAEFEVVDFPYSGTSCSALTTELPGYVIEGSDCQDLNLIPAGGASCILTFQQQAVNISVQVGFQDDNPATVTVALSCQNASVEIVEGAASLDEPARFRVRAFPHTGTTCVATATPPVGYRPQESDCDQLAVALDTGDTCSMLLVSDRERVPILEALSGSWYEPTTSGQGFMLHSTERESAVMYFYGFDADGNHIWLLSQSEGPFAWGEPIPFETFIASGGGFEEFDKSQVTVVPWGVAEVTLENCLQGKAFFSGPDGEKSLDFERLGTVAGSHCNEIGVDEPRTSVTGSWYELETSGQGFSIHKVSADRGVAYFYGYDDDGSRLWLIGTWNESFEFGKTIELPLKWVTGGTWDVVDPADILREDWGMLSLRFDDCDSGEAILEGIHGRQELDLVRLAGAFGLECTNPLP